MLAGSAPWETRQARLSPNAGLPRAGGVSYDTLPPAPCRRWPSIPRVRGCLPNRFRFAVDLDGTLIRSDMLFESALSLLRRNPLYLFAFALWLARGRAHLKREIARRAQVDPATLPYDERVVSWLREQQGQRPQVLCTASDATLARGVADHLGLFDAVMASDGERNLAGRHKGDALRERYGERGFDYAGNEYRDLHIWKHARRAVVVNADSGLARAAGECCEVERVFEPTRGGLRTWLKALRLHQWLKNLLVFLPLFTSHRVLEAATATSCALAFLAFGLCASGVYLLNDLFDLDADRRHPRKRLRPFAAGTLPLWQGLLAAPLLALAGLALALSISLPFAGVLACYYGLTLAYSLRLKRIVMLDVVILAALYTVRIIGGAVVIGGGLSFWLLAFSMFPVPEPRDAQALYGTARPARQRQGRSERPRLFGRGHPADPVARGRQRLHERAGAGAVHQQHRERGAVSQPAGAVAAVPLAAVLDQPGLADRAPRPDARRSGRVRPGRPRQPRDPRPLRDRRRRGDLSMTGTSWGRYPLPQAQRLLAVRDRDAALPAFDGTALPHGNGRSYGDVCLNDGGTLLCTRGLDRFIAFDAQQGVLRCEAGVLLGEILDLVVSQGWFLPVTPGTKYVTVGGAIANDVHGKNHHVAGCFSEHVNGFELLRSDGSRRWCSTTENADWFAATVAGLGLTGLITWAELRLQRVRGPWLNSETHRFREPGGVLCAVRSLRTRLRIHGSLDRLRRAGQRRRTRPLYPCQPRAGRRRPAAVEAPPRGAADAAVLADQ